MSEPYPTGLENRGREIAWDRAIALPCPFADDLSKV